MIPEAEEKAIVISGPCTSSYVDEDYFADKMKEDHFKNYITHAVEFRCLRAEHLINEKCGFEFLQEMLRQRRMNLFNTPYMMLLI